MNQLPRDQFLQFKFIAAMKKNPSETQFAYTVSNQRYKQNDYVFELYLSDGDKTRKLLNAKGEGRYFWEDDTTILVPYAKTAEEKKQVKAKKTVLYRLNTETKELTYACTLPIPVSNIKVLKDKKQWLIQTQISVSAQVFFDEKKRGDFLSEQKDLSFCETFDEVPFYLNGAGFLKGARNQAFIYTVKSAQFDAVVEPDFSIDGLDVDEVNGVIYYFGSHIKHVMPMDNYLYQYDIETKARTQLLDKPFSIENVKKLSDELIVAGSDAKEYGINQNPDFYRYNNGKLELLAEFGFTAHSSIGSDCRYGGSPTEIKHDDNFWFVGLNNYSSNIVEVSQTGALYERFVADGSSIDGLLDFKGRVFAILLLDQSLQEIYELDLENNGYRQLTHHNRNSLKGYYVAAPEYIDYLSDSVQLDGWVLKPKDYNPKTKYPAILVIHGGPKTVYSEVYYHEMQVWANEGYFVFFTNPRGGDGRFGDFSDIRGKYGTIDYDDLMRFTDTVLSAYPAIDRERLGVTGGSYGGFMTNWIVGHTDRFKAAATQRSISNWISFYGTSDIGFYFASDQNAAVFNTPEGLEKMWSHSPLKYVEQVNTPLLFVHSDEDYRCPIEQALQYYTRLTERGIDTRFVWFKGENHDLSRSGKPQARVKRLQEITDWMDKYLR